MKSESKFSLSAIILNTRAFISTVAPWVSLSRKSCENFRKERCRHSVPAKTAAVVGLNQSKMHGVTTTGVGKTLLIVVIVQSIAAHYA